MRESVTLTIKSADTMTKQEKREACDWIMEQGMALVMEGEQYDKTYTGRYYIDEKKEK